MAEPHQNSRCGPLAVLLRTAQWSLDDLAHDLPAGRATPQRLIELASALEQLAAALRTASGVHDVNARMVGPPNDLGADGNR